MKRSLLTLVTTSLLAVSATAMGQTPPTPTDRSAAIEEGLKLLERSVLFYLSTRDEADKKMKQEYSSNPEMQKRACVGVRAMLADTLEDFRSRAVEIGKSRAQMSQTQLARFTDCSNKLRDTPADVPACGDVPQSGG